MKRVTYKVITIGHVGERLNFFKVCLPRGEDLFPLINTIQ
jgi:hypothetical protein